MLAVGNDKAFSTGALLKVRADVNIRDSSDDQAIHEAATDIPLRKHSLKIISLLLDYGADVNSISKNGAVPVPMKGAVESFPCAKLMLSHGANIYFQYIDDTLYKTYSVWFSLLLNEMYDNIFVAKYLIIDKGMPIPDPITFSMGRHLPLDIRRFLGDLNFHGDQKKQETKEQIIAYLEKIDFPKNDVYIEKRGK